MNNNELQHYGVPGMKWGVRKKGYITVGQGKRNAYRAANEARKKSIAESRASSDSSKPGSFARANRKAVAAKKQAYVESIKKDKAHNKEYFKKASGDTSKRASSVKEWGARYVNKSNEIKDYQASTRQARKKIKNPISRFNQLMKDNWNQPAMTLSGKDTTYGKEYTKSVLTNAVLMTAAVAYVNSYK